jgi:hypothetical protein
MVEPHRLYSDLFAVVNQKDKLGHYRPFRRQGSNPVDWAAASQEKEQGWRGGLATPVLGTSGTDGMSIKPSPNGTDGKCD